MNRQEENKMTDLDSYFIKINEVVDQATQNISPVDFFFYYWKTQW